MEMLTEEQRSKTMAITNVRPGPYEAWGMLPMSEYDTVVWTEEMSSAFFTVEQLISDGEVDKAMVAFITKYKKLCDEAANKNKPVVWKPSLGWERKGRFSVLADAVLKGRITLEQAINAHPEMTHEFMKIKKEKTA